MALNLGSVVAEELATHLDEVGPIEAGPAAVTSPRSGLGRPVRVSRCHFGERQTRPAAVLFTSSRGKLLTDTYWSELWADWRQAAG